jgi:hypothetical protein
MKWWVRTLLIWSLVLAVPAQVAAAATMAFCGPNHHGGAVAVSTQQGEPAVHAHHGGDASEAHEHHQHSPNAEEEVHSSSTSSSPDPVSHGKHKCSACASCCSIGAIPSAALAVPKADFSPTVFSAVVPTVDRFAADGPDRPPRIVLA